MKYIKLKRKDMISKIKVLIDKRILKGSSKMEEYVCNRCQNKFKISHKVSISGATCTPCWDFIRQAKTVKEYYKRVNQRTGE